MSEVIKLHGHFGPSYVDEKGLFHKGITLLDVIEQVEPLKDVKELTFSIDSPGGYVDIGDSVYNYMIALKSKGIKIITRQDGLVGSIATKPFLAGDERIVDDRFQFWIHNPYQENVSGDHEVMSEVAKGLEQTEAALRSFYSQFTSIPNDALDQLMKQETGLTAEQCVKFGFATGKKKTPVLNIIKSTINKMANKDEKSFMEHVKAFFTGEEKPKGVAPKTKNEIPGQGEKKSLVVTLADGAGSFWVEGESVAAGQGAFLLDADGQPTMEPLPDGEYMLEDGSLVLVAAGLVTEVKGASEGMEEEEKDMEEEKEEPAALTAEMVQQMIAAELAKANEVSQAEINKVKEEASNEILALKKNIKLGIAPQKAVLNVSGQKLEYKTIAQRMEEKREERKKQLNKN